VIFLDVGGHRGQTLEEVLKHKFTWVHCFEPMPAEYAYLQETYGHLSKLTLHNFGLAESTGQRNVYGTNAGMEASLFADKVDADAGTVTVCEFVEASEFFRTNLGGSAIVKLNCEGSETLILNNLIDSGEIWKIVEVMIDFDVRKIPKMKKEEKRTLDRLRAMKFDRFVLSEKVMIGETHQDRIANWLRAGGWI
jgi:FkbM family methyltransferase